MTVKSRASSGPKRRLGGAATRPSRHAVRVEGLRGESIRVGLLPGSGGVHMSGFKGAGRFGFPAEGVVAGGLGIEQDHGPCQIACPAFAAKRADDDGDADYKRQSKGAGGYKVLHETAPELKR